MESNKNNSVTLTQKRIASAKGLHLVCAIVAMLLNIIAFVVLAINVSMTEIMYLAFPLALAVLDIIFLIKVVFSNYRFSYAVNGAIWHSVIVLLVSVAAYAVMGTLEEQNGIVFVTLSMYAMLIVHVAQSIATLTTALYATKSKKGAAKIFGHQMLVVITDSMGKCEVTDVSDFEIGSIPQGSLIFVQSVPDDQEKAEEWYDDLEVGDVLTFRYVYSQQITITHRITKIEEKQDGGYIISLAGDNVNTENQGQLYQVIDTSETNTPNYIMGKVVGQSRALGFAITILKEPLGMVFTIIVPCFIIIILEVIKIYNVLSEEKKKQAQSAAESKDNELAELRKRLADLEKQASEQSSAAEQTQSDKTEE